MQIVIISVLACILIGENVLFFLLFKKIQSNLKKELANKFLNAYQSMSGRRLTIKEQHKMLSQLISEKMKK